MQKNIKVFWFVLANNIANFKIKQIENTWWDDVTYISNVTNHKYDQTPTFKKISFYNASVKFTDFAFEGVGLLWFNQRVVDAFDGELEKYGRLCPIDCEGAPWQYYFYHVTTLVKAMDLEAVAKVDPRYQPGEPYNSISRSKFEFISENIKDLLVFKDIQQSYCRNIYLSKRFVDILKKHKFTGVHKDTFKPIWPRPTPTTPQVGPKVDLADLNL